LAAPATDKSDIYSFGMVLLKLFTNKTALARAEPAAMKEVPEHVARIIRQCLEEQPERRKITAEKIRASLRKQFLSQAEQLRSSSISSDSLRGTAPPTKRKWDHWTARRRNAASPATCTRHTAKVRA